MEKNNPLLPFAFSTSAANERTALNTDPRERHVIDENAESMYHTRGKQKRVPAPFLASMPSMKRHAGESFNEKDDVKKRDFGSFPLQGLTNPPIDTDPDDSQSHGLPSSPPVLPHMSEYDLSTSNYNMPDSPVDTYNVVGELTTSPVKRPARATANQSSEADFGIDPFNRFKTSSYIHCPSTDADMGDASTHTGSGDAKARDLILQAFEDVSPSVSLEGMGLTEIPEQVKDLENLVIFDPERSTQVLHQLYLTNNRLHSINPALFKFTKLNVLSLRHNKIDHIPGAICNLKNLVDLNISSNRLVYLPAQILELPQLATFRAGPNPFEAVHANAIEIVDTVGTCQDPCLRYISRINYFQKKGMVPTLKTLCLDAVARYDVTYRETKSWKKTMPKVLHPFIAKAILKRNYEEHCNECNVFVVEPYAEVIEWWDILANKEVPIKREFCSGKCTLRYWRRHEQDYANN
ncbi:CIC11C00000000555 [Sungouiella intermedia]|uniref:CIC11C00000000555 n=1 Tax=Sungouiella intermedia TaxID=45354 RepID=A0A1L0D5V3_9ASCO|nr:CIC11C00000000555 [[Candida] intermedia]